MLQHLLQTYFCLPHETAFFDLSVGRNDLNRDHSKFRASDAGKCHRMRYWKRQGKAGAQDVSFEVEMIFQVGHLLHAFIQHALSDIGVVFASEQPLEDPHRIGHLDALVQDDGKLVLYDFKTVGGKQMYYLKQDRSPKADHLAQVRTYHQMYVTTEGGTQEYQSIDECRIAYISRDTLEIVDLLAPENFHAVNADWQTLIGYWERQETPPMTRNEWECKYCQYSSDCPHARTV